MIGLLISSSVIFNSCSTDNLIETSTSENTNTPETKLTKFVAGVPDSRSSMNRTTHSFFWEAGDNIWVQDEDGNWNVSANHVDQHCSQFVFNVPGRYVSGHQYKVFYTGKYGETRNYNEVDFRTLQFQKEPDNTIHIGGYGDCGVAVAQSIGNSYFSFALEHKSSILLFQPYTANTVLDNCYLTRIELKSDDDFAGTYIFDPADNPIALKSSIYNISNSASIITKGDPGSAYEKGFPLQTRTPNPAQNGTYMAIKPGTYKFTVTYVIKDYTTEQEVKITKELPIRTYEANKFYNMPQDLKLLVYPSNNYYMWDAQENFWAGHEWDPNNLYASGTTYGKNSTLLAGSPQSNAADPTRWCNETFPGVNVPNRATSNLFKTLPNANELAWYVIKGDPRWDANKAWSIMGHLYKGGMWFKKMSVIANENGKTLGAIRRLAPTGVDFRKYYQNYTNTEASISSGVPASSEIDKYFYLPAIGYSLTGGVVRIGDDTIYWSDTADPNNQNAAYGLYFINNGTYVGNYVRTQGSYTIPFE